VPVLPVSAKTGQGFDVVAGLLEKDGSFGSRILNIDYDVYADGEAELGWLNSNTQVAADHPFALDQLLLGIVRRLKSAISELNAEVAHLKAIGLGESTFGVANLVSSAAEPELSLPSHSRTREAEVIINARVAIDPIILQEQVQQALTAACSSMGVQCKLGKTESFRPGRPQPTHRYATAK
jgi:hypothetical protein